MWSDKELLEPAGTFRDVIRDEETMLVMIIPAMPDEFLGDYHAAFYGGNEAREAVTRQYGITFS